jgi:peptide deformylase
MSVRPILIYGEEVLHEVAAPVVTFDASLRELVADMFDTMDAAPGVGLAAPQVGVGLRLFVYDYPDDEGNERRGVAINPELFISPTEVRETTSADDEGCLSFPGERYPLIRAEQAILHAVNLDGVAFEMTCDGWFARILQHEFDHLNGVIYVDRLGDPFLKDADKVMRKSGWGKPGNRWTPGIDSIEA